MVRLWSRWWRHGLTAHGEAYPQRVVRRTLYSPTFTHYEVNFPISEDLDIVPDLFDAQIGSVEEMGSEDDLCFYLYKYGEAQ